MPCHPLPTAHTEGEILSVDVPETIHGNLLLSADDLEAGDGPSDQSNVFERLRWMPMAEQIDHSVFVYRGDFHIPEAAALAAIQKSTILLRENRPAEALIAARKAVAWQPESLPAQTALKTHSSIGQAWFPIRVRIGAGRQHVSWRLTPSRSMYPI